MLKLVPPLDGRDHQKMRQERRTAAARTVVGSRRGTRLPWTRAQATAQGSKEPLRKSGASNCRAPRKTRVCIESKMDHHHVPFAAVVDFELAVLAPSEWVESSRLRCALLVVDMVGRLSNWPGSWVSSRVCQCARCRML